MSTMSDPSHKLSIIQKPINVIYKPGNLISNHEYLNWDGDYSNWDLVRFGVPLDGNCFFHAVCQAFFKPYITEMINGKPISRLDLVKKLREELSEKLSQPVKGNSGPTFYDLLNGGNTREFSKSVPKYTLTAMQKLLNSNSPIGYGYIEYISNQLNKDIYILDASTQDIYVYVNDEYNLTFKNRNSIVLLYISGHYELIGLKNKNYFDTHFSPNHPLIIFLKSRIKPRNT